MDRSWRFPNLGHELLWIAGGFVVAAGLIGAGIGVAVDWTIHRHRATAAR